jgi:hypothetical protein
MATHIPVFCSHASDWPIIGYNQPKPSGLYLAARMTIPLR